MFCKNLTVSGFEPRTSGIGSDHSANWATATAHSRFYVRPANQRIMTKHVCLKTKSSVTILSYKNIWSQLIWLYWTKLYAIMGPIYQLFLILCGWPINFLLAIGSRYTFCFSCLVFAAAASKLQNCFELTHLKGWTKKFSEKENSTVIFSFSRHLLPFIFGLFKQQYQGIFFLQIKGRGVVKYSARSSSTSSNPAEVYLLLLPEKVRNRGQKEAWNVPFIWKKLLQITDVENDPSK